MEYRAVGNRCAIDFSALSLPNSFETIQETLTRKGYSFLPIDLIKHARLCIGVSEYRRAAHIREAPAVVDCSSFTKWLYGLSGIWLPRRPIQQREYGIPVAQDDIQAGDLVFTTGRTNLYIDDPADGVGHVGIATNEGTVIHAANSRIHVVEVSLEDFTKKKDFRGIRRYIPNPQSTHTIQIPEGRAFETSDDMKWILLRTLSRT